MESLWVRRLPSFKKVHHIPVVLVLTLFVNRRGKLIGKMSRFFFIIIISNATHLLRFLSTSLWLQVILATRLWKLNVSSPLVKYVQRLLPFCQMEGDLFTGSDWKTANKWRCPAQRSCSSLKRTWERNHPTD